MPNIFTQAYTSLEVSKSRQYKWKYQHDRGACNVLPKMERNY
jgi:hypothetical protein